MADLLKKFQEEHVPQEDDQVLHKTIVHGDQLTEERARNVQWTYKLGKTEADHLEGLECTFSEYDVWGTCYWLLLIFLFIFCYRLTCMFGLPIKETWYKESF